MTCVGIEAGTAAGHEEEDVVAIAVKTTVAAKVLTCEE
jgi:hypothetical protein